MRCRPRSASPVSSSPYDCRDVPGWVIWAIVAVGLAVGEILTPGLFFLGPVALAAAAATAASLLGAGTVGSVIVFLVGSLLSLLFLRPIARRHVHLPMLSKTGTDALVGRKAVVTREIGP